MRVSIKSVAPVVCFVFLFGFSEGENSSSDDSAFHHGIPLIPFPDVPSLNPGVSSNQEQGEASPNRDQEVGAETDDESDSKKDGADSVEHPEDASRGQDDARGEKDSISSPGSATPGDENKVTGTEGNKSKNGGVVEEMVEGKTVRVLAFGDQDEGSDAKFVSGKEAAKTCEEPGCDLALLLGDDFDGGGVNSVDDSQFESKCELPYAELDMPFSVVQGNHDYGERSFEWYPGDVQKGYALENPKWVLPKEYYSLMAEEGLADFFAFNTARIMWSNMVEEQRVFLDDAIARSDAEWKVAFAHHPSLSNGKHGNAGRYEGYSFIPIADHASVKEFLHDVICGKVDLYLCGYDHNRQSFKANAYDCGVHLIVNGASSKTIDSKYHDDNTTLWHDDQKEGYVWAETASKEITVVWLEFDENIDVEDTIEK